MIPRVRTFRIANTVIKSLVQHKLLHETVDKVTIKKHLYSGL